VKMSMISDYETNNCAYRLLYLQAGSRVSTLGNFKKMVLMHI
jgi:hypothetical protein